MSLKAWEGAPPQDAYQTANNNGSSVNGFPAVGDEEFVATTARGPGGEATQDSSSSSTSSSGGGGGPLLTNTDTDTSNSVNANCNSSPPKEVAVPAAVAMSEKQRLLARKARFGIKTEKDRQKERALRFDLYHPEVEGEKLAQRAKRFANGPLDVGGQRTSTANMSESEKLTLRAKRFATTAAPGADGTPVVAGKATTTAAASKGALSNPSTTTTSQVATGDVGQMSLEDRMALRAQRFGVVAAAAATTKESQPAKRNK